MRIAAASDTAASNYLRREPLAQKVHYARRYHPGGTHSRRERNHAAVVVGVGFRISSQPQPHLDHRHASAQHAKEADEKDGPEVVIGDE